ncbi:hypothetical protein ACSBR2_039763 [Camellia fascicularis]
MYATVIVIMFHCFSVICPDATPATWSTTNSSVCGSNPLQSCIAWFGWTVICFSASGPADASSAQQAPMNTNLHPHHPSAAANEQQLPLQQSASQFAQMLSQQKQTLQASFQSSQQAFSQLQQQFRLIQPSNQNLMSHQFSQATK